MGLDINLSYTGRDDNAGAYGGFKDSLLWYRDSIINTLNFDANTEKTTKMLERAKLIRPAYGQRSTYNAELPANWQDLFPRYFFTAPDTNGSNYTESWNGEVVSGKFCQKNLHSPGYIVKGLYENQEQVNFMDTLGHKWDIGYFLSDKKETGDASKWYIKPRMRIPISFANDSTMQDSVVVILVIVNFNGDEPVPVNDSIPIYVKNFKRFGVYNGEYLELFYNSNNSIKEITADAQYLCKGRNQNPVDNSKVDYRIYWPGNVTVYLDYVRVDDEWAHFLFNDSLDVTHKYDFKDKIHEEVTAFGNNQYLGYFYMDECPINSFPCIAEVNRLIKEVNPSKGIFAIMMEETAMKEYGRLRFRKPSIDQYVDYILKLDSLMTDVFLYTCYPFHNGFKYPSNLTVNDEPQRTYYSPASSPAEYNNLMMSRFQVNTYNSNNDTLPNGQVVLSYNIMSEMVKKSKLAGRDISPAFFIQAHSFEDWHADWYNLREPTNKEMMLQGNLALIYGAKQVYLFSYNTDQQDDFKGKPRFSRGLMQDSNAISQRTSNYFGQNKWQGAINVSTSIQKIGDVLYPSGDRTKHLVYVDSRSVNNISYPEGIPSGPQHLFIEDIVSKFNTPSVYQNSNPQCIDCDATNERYWEFGFFDPPSNSANEMSKYLLALNKRSTPDTLLGEGVDTRMLQIKFNLSYLAGYNNWMIKDAVTNEVISKFDKNSTTFVNAGTYKPAEAKLLKIVPVMVEGDTLIANETLSGNINCKGMVYNGGHNITISPATTISFADNAGIEMIGGTFTCGDYSSESPVTLKGVNNSNVWKGLVLENCSSVGIYNTSISKIKDDNVCKAVLISNCNNINIKASTFNVGTNAAAINAAFTSNTEEPVSFNVSECNFVMGGSGNDALYITSNGASSIPVIIDWCTFTTSNENSNALRLINITGGAVKNSTFVNFKTTINTFGSVIDVYNNKILGRTNSTGILSTDGSNISMKPVSGTYLGGFNYIKNFGSSSSCINTDNSIFNINYGQNDFDLSDLDNSKFFTGTFGGDAVDNVEAIKNCFHKDSLTNVEANHSVTWYSTNNPVSFTFTDYSCELTPPNDFFVLQYTGYNDTIFYGAGGTGGGINPNKTLNVEENTYKSLKDTVNINLRKRSYLTVEDKAKQILTQYPDSLESISMVQKLYMASLNLDSSKIGLTKTFLENLIATNTQNPGLIKRAFYFVQKCKVKLGQYQSALDGFQYIMTQNPYTYEGLVASWDYAATFLLMGSGGSYKGELEQTIEELNTPADTLLSRMTKRDINTNKTKNNSSSEQITKTFYEKVKNVTKDDKTTQEAKVKTLEKKIETSKNKTEKNDAATELATMKQIKEVVKVKKPNTVMKHIQIMNDDIKKVFGVGKGGNKESENNLIPKTYTLYQNYPNPFNPTTKIAYDIPRDAKVKLVIYDILGREMKTLVNNEFRSAGKYITEFNGSNLASGIYFARILVNEGKDFMAVKKMVLVK